MKYRWVLAAALAVTLASAGRSQVGALRPPRPVRPDARGPLNEAERFRKRLEEKLSKVMYRVEWPNEKAPEKIDRNGDKPTAIVLADRVDLGDRVFVYGIKRKPGEKLTSALKNTAPWNVVLLAETVRVSAACEFDLTSSRMIGEFIGKGFPARLKDGGNLTILAGRLEFAGGGRLTFTSNGARGTPASPGGPPRTTPPKGIPKSKIRPAPPRPKVPGGNGGQLTIAVESIEGVPGLNAGNWKATLLKEGRIAFISTPGIDGKAGEATISNVRQAIQDRTIPQDIVTLWAVHRIELLLRKVLDAERTKVSRFEIGSLFRAYEKLPPYKINAPEYTHLLQRMNELRSKMFPALWHETVRLEVEGQPPRILDTFTRGVTRNTFLAPTTALVRSFVFDGKPVLGLAYRHPATGRLTLTLEAQLTVDPWQASRAAERLKENDQTYAGAFHEWTVEGLAGPVEGVEKIHARLAGDVLQLTLELSSNDARATRAQLRLSDSGLEIPLKWRPRDDPTFKPLPLKVTVSLARRKKVDLVGEGGSVKNPEDHPVVVEYARWGGRFHALQPALVIPARGSTRLPGASGMVLVPAEALAHQRGAKAELLGTFGVARPGDVMQTVIVRNDLPIRDPIRGELRSAEVIVKHREKGVAGGAEAGPYRLRPGEEVEVIFIRRGKGTAEVEARGMAIYSRSSARFLKKGSGPKEIRIELGD